MICLVESVGPDRIEARRITTQEQVTFDIGTAANIEGPGSRLVSIMPLPVEVHDVLLGLDRRMRLGTMPLSEAEKEALQFVADFYSAHLVEAFSIVGT